MSGWPDPARPGVPLNPERDGWHFCETACSWFVVRWDALAKAWHTRTFLAPAEVANLWLYLGPCLTSSELAAREAAAFQRGIQAAATVAERYPASTHGNMAGNPEEAARDAANEIAAAIRALPVPEEKA